MEICQYHLCNKPTRGGLSRYCSVNCKTKHNVIAWRKRTKLALIEYKGGKCERCGYDKCVRALEFHHKDPTQKEFALSGKGRTRSLEKMKREVDKCSLLCSNCHAEVHDDYGPLV